MNLSDDLQKRGILKQITHPDLLDKLNSDSLCFYCGFDPTSDSLHVGSLLPLLTLRRLQMSGHRPIALIGGATGMVGDPSGKTEERKLLGTSDIETNLAGISEVVSRVLHTNDTSDTSGSGGARIMNNASWFKEINYIEFLRTVGKHFTVNHMLAKESVRARLEDREHGISYTEFSYMLLQAYDFYFLHENHGCRLQVGGSDQWGNITAGIDLIRKAHSSEKETTYGLTHPLVVRSDGLKFGKSEKGTVWLSPKKTSPYEFYQFFVQTQDHDVVTYLNYFTFLEHHVIFELKKSLELAPDKREAQITLAREVTRIVHGQAELDKVERASHSLFGDGAQGLLGLDEKSLLAALPGVPRTVLSFDRLQSQKLTLIDVLVETKICSSKGMSRREIEAGGIYVNQIRVSESERTILTGDIIAQKFLVLRKGKKNYHLIEFE